LPAKLDELLLERHLPTIGPKTAEMLQQYVDAAQPPMAEREHVEVMLAKLSLATANQRRSVEEEAERLELYWMTLRIYPLVDLRSAFLKLLRGCKFMPTPSEIDSVVQAEGSERRRKVGRARYLIQLHKRDYVPPVEYVTSEELAELKTSITIAASYKHGS